MVIDLHDVVAKENGNKFNYGYKLTKILMTLLFVN